MMEKLAAWWDGDAARRRAYALAAGIGFVAFLVVLGPRFLFGTSAYWDMPRHDHRAYLMGYRYFLDEPWHWPMFVVHAMNVPYTKSIAFTDSIPLWAFVNKAIATVVPPWGGFSARAYLGMWYAIAFALQPVAGVAVVRGLGRRTWGAVVVTSLVVLAMPAWGFRFYHASLFAQFLLLAALAMYVRTPVETEAPRRLRLAQLGHLFVACAINPYHGVIGFGVAIASWLRPRVRRLRTVAIWAPSALAAMGTSLWLAGFFAKEAKAKMWGFDAASANLLTFFSPRMSGLVGERLWTDGTGYQYEGLAYLGAGVLVLFVLFLPRARLLRGVISRHRYLVAIAAAAGLFSLSNRIFFASHKVLGFTYPHALHWVQDQFRSPGRFIWLPMYVIVLFLVAWALGRFTRGWQRWLLPALAVLQIADVRGDWTWAQTDGAWASYLRLDSWRPLVAAHRAVWVMPTNDCVLGGSPGVDLMSSELEYLASEHALPINGVYSARPTRKCATDDTTWPTAPADGELYVFLESAQAFASAFAAAGATCTTFAWNSGATGVACSKNTAAMATASAAGAFPVPPPAPTVAVGTRIDVGDPASAAYLVAGWSWQDKTGRFSEGHFSTIKLRVGGPRAAPPALKLQMSSVMCGKRQAQDVTVSLNGTKLGVLHFAPDQNDDTQVRTLAIPDPHLLDGDIELAFHADDVRPPSKVACNEDDRPIGFFLRSFAFE